MSHYVILISIYRYTSYFSNFLSPGNFQYTYPYYKSFDFYSLCFKQNVKLHTKLFISVTYCVCSEYICLFIEQFKTIELKIVLLPTNWFNYNHFLTYTRIQFDIVVYKVFIYNALTNTALVKKIVKTAIIIKCDTKHVQIDIYSHWIQSY